MKPRMKINVKPLESAIGVTLTSTKDEVRNKLGQPSHVIGSTDHFQNTLPMFSVDYDSNDSVEYISISNPNSDMVKVSFMDHSVFEVDANTLIEIIENETNYRFDRNDPELEYSFIFHDLELSFWRPTIPENEDDEDGKYFETIGIGIKGYYD